MNDDHDNSQPTSTEESARKKKEFQRPSIDLLRRLEVELCRTDVRTTIMRGREFRSNDNSKQTITRMCFYLASWVYDYLRTHADGAGRPQYNQITEHLQKTGQPLGKNVQISKCFDGTSDRGDFGQAQESLKFLLLGSGEQGDLSTEEHSDANQIWESIKEYFFRFDKDDVQHSEVPRFFLAERRPHSVPASQRELSGEFLRAAWKLKHRLATAVEIMWVLGAEAFIRDDLNDHVPDALAFAVEAGYKVNFVYVDELPDSWELPKNYKKPSESITHFRETKIPTEHAKRVCQICIPGTSPGSSGDWAFMMPCNQMIYMHVDSTEKAHDGTFAEEYLYILRGFSRKAAENAPLPLVSKANREELRAFTRWFKSVQKYTVS